MGKIDKERLLKELTDWHVPEQIINIVEAVPEDPEEPEIDFDDLYNDWCKNTKEWVELRSPYDQARSLRDFLKSKNLTQPQVDMDALRNEIYASIQKQSEIPVKKYWTLKEKFKPLLLSYGIRALDVETVLPLNIVEFYDYHEEPDYSQVPVGAVVEVVENGNLDNVYGIVIEVTSTCIILSFKNQILNSSYTVRYGSIKSLEILKWPENV